MPDNYEHYISKNIQAFYRRRLFSPMIYLVLLAVLWIVFPLGAMLRPAQLSGGMQQRVSIARGLAVQPDVLFMDEPFAALDAITRLKMQDDIHRIAEEEGVTVVFVTHDIEEAVALADRIVVLTPNPGRVKEIIKVELGPDRLRTADDFLAVRDHVFDVFGMKPNWNVEYVI